MIKTIQTVLLSLIVVLATVTPTASAATSGNSANTPAVAPPKKTQEERYADYKAALTTPLTPGQLANIKAKSQAAQIVGRVMTERIATKHEARLKLYKEIASNLDKLIEGVKETNLKPDDLNKQKTELNSLISKYETAYNSYKQVLDDLSAVDSLEDPTAFQATLEAARIARQDVSKRAADLRKFLAEVLPPQLLKAKTELGNEIKSTKDKN